MKKRLHSSNITKSSSSNNSNIRQPSTGKLSNRIQLKLVKGCTWSKIEKPGKALNILKVYKMQNKLFKKRTKYTKMNR